MLPSLYALIHSTHTSSHSRGYFRVSNRCPLPANLSRPTSMSLEGHSSGESDLPTEIDEVPSDGPRCSRCDQVRSNEWINWQKCWSEPITGENGQSYCLSYPRDGKPMMLRMQGSGSYEDKDFWWFFLCTTCRLILLRGGVSVDNAEIEDRFHPGGKGKLPQMRPTFVPKNIVRDQWLDMIYGTGGFWMRPLSPASSESSNPWNGHF